MIGFKELLIIGVIIILIFGTSKLKNVGSDLGAAIKNFKKSMKDGEGNVQEEQQDKDQQKKS